MKVIYSTETAYGLTIICPTIHMNSWLEKDPDEDSFNENMWQVDKEGYDKCEVNTKGNPRKNKLVLTCSDKWKIHDNSFFFMKTWGSEDELGPIFEPGEHYYFICKLLFFIFIPNKRIPHGSPRRIGSSKRAECLRVFRIKIHEPISECFLVFRMSSIIPSVWLTLFCTEIHLVFVLYNNNLQIQGQGVKTIPHNPPNSPTLANSPTLRNLQRPCQNLRIV